MFRLCKRFLCTFSFLSLFFVGCSAPMDPDALLQPFHHIPNYLNLQNATCEVTEKTAIIKNPMLTLVFNRGYQDMSINGITYYLNQSATMTGVSTRDLQILREALLTPSVRKNRLFVVVDAGHGGDDPGCNVGTMQEKKITFEVALEVKRLLELRGHKVMLTRDRDVKMSLKERTDKIAMQPVDASVSIHVNSTENPHSNARGVEVYLVPDVNCKSTTGYLPTTGSSVSQDFIIPSTKLAIAVHQRLKMMDSSVVDRGVRHAYFRLVRDVPAPCVLAEIGFINHPEERAQLAKATYRASIARAIADGIEDAFAAYPMSVK